MKYDFSTYLTQVLNEKADDDENVLIDALEAKTPVKDILSKIKYTPNEKDQTVTITYNDKPISMDVLNEFIEALAENPSYKKSYDEYKSVLSKDKPSLAKKIDKKLSKSKTRGGDSNKNAAMFKKLGEALVFRTACAFGENPDADFSKICKQIFENDSDDRIKSLMTIEDQFGEYGAINGFKEFKEKNKDSKDEEALGILEKLTPFYEKLADQGTPDIEVQDAIKEISSTIQTEFKKHYEEAQAEFEEGRESMNKNIKDPNFDWKDPITGKEAKGAKNLKAGVQKITNIIGSKADELGKKIMSSPHNLENDMLKVGVMACKFLVGGVHAVRSIAKFFGIGKSATALDFIKGHKEDSGFIDKTLNKFRAFCKNCKLGAILDIHNSILKKSDNKNINKMTDEQGEKKEEKDEKKKQESFNLPFIDRVLNEVEEQTQQNEADDIKKQREDFLNNKDGFKQTGSHIMNYIIKNYAYLIDLTLGKDKKICQFSKIENDEQEENTYGFDFVKSGSMTLIQDKLNLYIRSLDYFNKFYAILSEKDKSATKKLFIGDLVEIPQTFGNEIANLIKAIDKLTADDGKLKDNKIFKQALLDVKKIYENIFPIDHSIIKLQRDNDGFAISGYSLDDFKAKCDKVKSALASIKISPMTNSAVIHFESNDDQEKFSKNLIATLGGSFQPYKNDTEQEEGKKELQAKYKEIQDELKELNDTNKLENVNSIFEKITDKLDSTVDSIKSMISKLPEENEAKSKFNDDPKNTLTKIIYIKAAMKALNINESVALNNIISLLNEAEEQAPNYDEIKKEILNIVNSSDVTADNFKEWNTKAENIYTKIKEIYEKLPTDEKDKVSNYKDKPIQLIYALSALNKPEETNGKENTKNINDMAKKLKKIFSEENIANDEYNKLKQKYEELDKDIKAWIGDDKTKQERYTKGYNLIKRYGDDIIPKVWFANTFMDEQTNPTQNNSYNPFIDYSMLMLLEDDTNTNNNNTEQKNTETATDGNTEENKEKQDNTNVAEKVKELHAAIETLLSTKDDFTTKYDKWKNEVVGLFKKVSDKLENPENYKDPVQMVSVLSNYAKSEETEKSEETKKS